MIQEGEGEGEGEQTMNYPHHMTETGAIRDYSRAAPGESFCDWLKRNGIRLIGVESWQPRDGGGGGKGR